MRDVGETFDLHELRHAHRTGDADAPEVVAREIDEHCVLGTFLLVGAQIGSKQRVLLIIFAALPRACNGIGIDGIARYLDQHLGGGSDELYLTEVVVEHIGRGIDLSQPAVEEEGGT